MPPSPAARARAPLAAHPADVWAVVGSWAITIGLYQDLGLPIFALGYWILQWHERGSPSSQYFQPGPNPLAHEGRANRSATG